MTMDKKQEPMPNEDNRYDFIMIVALAFAFIVTIGLVTAVVVVTLKQSDKPRAAILNHPRGEVLVLGQTRDDLDQAM